MRTFRVALLGAAGLALAGSLPAQQFENVPQAKPAAPPAAAASINIGVLDFQAVMVSTQEGKKAAEDLRAEFNPRNAEMEKLRLEIRDLENQVRTQERTLSIEARMQLARQIEQKRKLGTRMEEDLRYDVEQAQNDIVNRLGEKVQRVIDLFAQEKSLSLVINISQGSPVVFATRAVDITEDVVRRYDETYPVEKAAAPPTPPAPTRPPPAPRSTKPPQSR